MPQPKVGLQNGDVTPEEAGEIRRSVAGKERAPTTREQASFVDWRLAADQLGQPFDVEKIPISKLRSMRRDPMLGFGLAFIKTPLVRAEWFIDAADENGPNAQVAANVDWALRRIYASLIFQLCNSLDFGFQAITKRYELRTPQGTFVQTNPDSGEQEELPLWSEGGIQPIVWKPFVPSPPELVEPIWKGGDFNGFTITPTQQQSPNQTNPIKIDVAHALWVTNDRDSVFGSIYGYPRLGYAYRYWWSYWFRWAIADRAFERKADPTIVVRHPDGDMEDAQGNVISYTEYALLMGERMRSGSTVALPSEPYLGEIDGKPSTTPQWDIEAVKDLVDFEPFDKSFDYLDVQKLRSLWIPEQAFLEGKGGTSSRNVAAEMGDSFVESQAVLASQHVDTINRWVIPQFLAVNFPEFTGYAKMVMKGFADRDLETMRAVVNLIGQQEAGSREMAALVDIKETLKTLGVPILPFNDQQRRLSEIAAEAEASAPPTVEPTPGVQVGVIPTGTGFSYVQPRERIVLLADQDGFLNKLPDTPHYKDKSIRAAAAVMREVFKNHYRDTYADFAEFLEEGEEVVELSVGDQIDKARKLVERWWQNRHAATIPLLLDRSRDIFNRVISRAGRIEMGKADLPEPTEDDYIEWVEQHAEPFIRGITSTTRDELTYFVAKKLDEGITDAQELSREIREHFADFPEWKADRLARTEIRDTYNAATLIGARAAGAAQVQAIDAQYGETDDDCEDRHGKIYDIQSALQEDEHPNGTLAWRVLKASMNIERTDDDEVLAHYDPDEGKVYLSSSLTPEQEREYLLTLGESLS